MHRPTLATVQALVLTAICTVPGMQLKATTAIVLRSRHRIVLAADSRAVYSANANATECKLFEFHDVYATVSGLAHYGASYRSFDAIREGFARAGSFQYHILTTASFLKHRAEKLLAGLQVNNPSEHRYLTRQTNDTSDFVQLAVAQTVNGQPMLGVIQLQRNRGENGLAARTTVCPGSCKRDAGIFYLGYWERIKPYVTDSGQQRSVGSAASLDRLIRLEINAHPSEVGAPINIIELNGSGARWLQNGGNCSLPGIGW